MLNLKVFLKKIVKSQTNGNSNETSEKILAHCEIVSMNLCKYWIGISSFLHYPIDGILLPSRE